MALSAAAEYTPDASDSRPKLKELLDKVETGLRLRRERESRWYIAKEFLKGNHYHRWENGKVIPPPHDARWLKKPRIIDNQIRVNIEGLLAYLLRTEPFFSTLAKSGEWDDQAATIVGRKILYHYWTLLGMGAKLERCGLWAFTTGIGLLKVGWDPFGGQRLQQYQTVEVPPAMPPPPELMMAQQQAMAMGQPFEMPPEFMPSQQQVPSGTIPAGEVTIDVVSPFEFIPDHGAETMEECAWVIHHPMRPVDEVRRMYPDLAAEIKPEDPDARGFGSQALASHGGAQPTRLTDKELNRVQIYELWQAGISPDEPGTRTVATKTRILSEGPTPKGYTPIPFAEWRDRVVPGEFWPDSTVQDLVPLNKQVNRWLSQLVDISNKFKTKYLAPIGSIEEGQINNEDGEVIEFQPGQRPEAVPPPPIPESIPKGIALFTEAIRSSSGLEAVLQGKMQGEMRSGRQVAYLQQYGETRIGLYAKHLSRLLERTGKMLLVMVQENVTEERLGRVIGRNRQMDVFYFKGSDLRGNTDVVVDTDSLLSFNKSERFDKLMQMADREIIGGDKVLELMEMADWGPAIEAKAQDRNVALRENEMWRRRDPVRQPFYFEDHQEHIAIHNSFRKSSDYEQMTPDERMGVDAHCQVHEQLFMQAAMPPPTTAPGQPPAETPEAEAENAMVKESGQEIAEGLPMVPPVAGPGPGGP